MTFTTVQSPSQEVKMRCLYENQNMDFNDVRTDIARYFGVGYTVTIHDGDGCTLFDRVPGFYCAGAVNDSGGRTVASFAIDYVTEKMDDGAILRHVLGVHIGPPGQWCRTVADLSRYNEWTDSLRTQFSGDCGTRA
jgi:hypothetical protein